MKGFRTAVAAAVPVVLAGWFVVTVFSQHPERGYDRLRSLDRTGTGVLIPNWRFFAPIPAMDDQHILYRLASEDHARHTEWRTAHVIPQRRFVHAFWFPGRRVDKAVFDVASTLLSNAGSMNPLTIEAKSAAYNLVTGFVRQRITPEPGFPLFQVMLVRYPGYDHSEDPKYDIVFEYESVEATA